MYINFFFFNYKMIYMHYLPLRILEYQQILEGYHKHLGLDLHMIKFHHFSKHFQYFLIFILKIIKNLIKGPSIPFLISYYPGPGIYLSRVNPGRSDVPIL